MLVPGLALLHTLSTTDVPHHQFLMTESDAPMRLDKLLAERGAGSRKDVDRLIRSGLVVIDGESVPKNGAKMKVPWSSCPIADGIDYPPPPLIVAYHKPLGVVSSMKDDQGRRDLASVLPYSWQRQMHPVGRLDADTTGLLLFCRDGDITHRLLHPKYVCGAPLLMRPLRVTPAVSFS